MGIVYTVARGSLAAIIKRENSHRSCGSTALPSRSNSQEELTHGIDSHILLSSRLSDIPVNTKTATILMIKVNYISLLQT